VGTRAGSGGLEPAIDDGMHDGLVVLAYSADKQRALVRVFSRSGAFHSDIKKAKKEEIDAFGLSEATKASFKQRDVNKDGVVIDESVDEVV